jgi:uncharacterized membrane protein
VLIAVLALSLFGNAVTLGALMRLREIREDLIGPDTKAVALPKTLREELRAALKERRVELAPALSDLLRTRRTLIEAMKAQPFDPAATDALMTAFRSDLDALLAKVQVILLDHLDDR